MSLTPVSVYRELRLLASRLYYDHVHCNPLLNPFELDWTQDLHRGQLTDVLDLLRYQLPLLCSPFLSNTLLTYYQEGPAWPSWSLPMHMEVSAQRASMSLALGAAQSPKELAHIRRQAVEACAAPLPWRAKFKGASVINLYQQRALEILDQLQVEGLEELKDDIKERAVREPLLGEWTEWQEDIPDTSGKHGYHNIIPDVHTETPATILFLHSGDYVFGAPACNRGIAWRLARDTGMRVLVPAYRLAPEYQFPASLQDALATYLWLTDRSELGLGIAPEQIVLGGASAGGGLACALLLALRNSGQPLPAGAFLWSPWVDQTLSSPSYSTNVATDSIPPVESIFSWKYSKEALRSPYISPLFADDLSGLPPVLVQTGQCEQMRDDGVQLASRIRAATRKQPNRPAVRLELYAGQPHFWHHFHVTTLSREAVKRTAGFALQAVDRALHRSPVRMRSWRLVIGEDASAKKESW